MSSGWPTVAVFDLDGTITRHDTYLRYLIGYLRHQPSRLLSTLSLPVDLFRFALGAVDNAYVKARFLEAILAGHSRSELDVWTATFLDTLCQRDLRPGALARIAQHRTQGDRLILGTDLRDVSLLAYSDHHADLPLLTAATRAVAVNPTRKLQAAAALYGFSIENWG